MAEDAGLIAVPVSAGELIDKLTILAIKARRIADPAKLANVRRELALLEAAKAKHGLDGSATARLTGELLAVNERLWDIEDDIRDCERRGDFGEAFVALARSVYRTNDRRAEIKRQINDLAGSLLVEEKSYRSY